jgi:DNA repair exonuclease SbcCD ATPase subunit
MKWSIFAKKPPAVTTYEMLRNLDAIIAELQDSSNDPNNLAPRTLALARAAAWLRKLQKFLKETDMGQLATAWSAVNAELTTLKNANASLTQQLSAAQAQVAALAAEPTLDAADQAALAAIQAEAASVSQAAQPATPAVAAAATPAS